MYKKKKILSLIVARAGSKGLRNKNILMFKKKPMVQWSMIASKKSRFVDYTIVSTDSEKIINIANKAKINAPFKRPLNLAKDKSKIQDVIQHSIQWLKKNEKLSFDFLLLLQATSPLRTHKHIDQSIKYYFKNSKSLKDTMVSVTAAHQKVGWLMTKKKKYIRFLFKKKNLLLNSMRQELPKFYIPNGAIFFCNLSNFKGSFYTSKTLYYEMNKNVSIDIDTKEDMNRILRK